MNTRVRSSIFFQAIHDAEADVEILKIDMEKARDTLANAKLKLREQQKGGTNKFFTYLQGR